MIYFLRHFANLASFFNILRVLDNEIDVLFLLIVLLWMEALKYYKSDNTGVVSDCLLTEFPLSNDPNMSCTGLCPVT